MNCPSVKPLAWNFLRCFGGYELIICCLGEISKKKPGRMTGSCDEFCTTIISLLQRPSMIFSRMLDSEVFKRVHQVFCGYWVLGVGNWILKALIAPQRCIHHFPKTKKYNDNLRYSEDNLKLDTKKHLYMVVVRSGMIGKILQINVSWTVTDADTRHRNPRPPCFPQW
jgi:hypothetical protein